jgi:hypothetical protein
MTMILPYKIVNQVPEIAYSTNEYKKIMSRYFLLVRSTNLLRTRINKILYMVKIAYLLFQAANKTNTDTNVKKLA